MASVHEGSGQYWLASNQPSYGSGSLLLTSITQATTLNGSQVYAGSGSANTTLVIQDISNGPVTMQINFSTGQGGSATPAPEGDTIATLRALPSQVFTAPKITPLSPGMLPTLAVVTAMVFSTATTAAPNTPTRLVSQTDSGGACQFTLKGAATKTVPCTVRMVYSAKEGTTGFEVIATERISNIPEASLIVTIKGEPKSAPVSYGWGDSIQQAASVYEGGIQAYAAASKDQRGASSVSFTSIAVTSTAQDGGKVYAPHGNATAKLIGSEGIVILEVSY